MFQQTAATARNKTKKEILKTKELSKPSVCPWIWDVFLDWSIIGITVFFAAKLHSLPIYLAAILIIGNRQHALAILGHEGAHYTLHSNRKLNDLLSNFFCFWPLLITTDGYRTLHFIHHNNTGTSKDPELLHKKARAPQWDLPLNKKKLILFIMKDMFGYSLPDLLIILTFSRPKNSMLLLPVFFLHSAFIAGSVAFGFWWIALIWYTAIATTFMMFFRCRLWIEHQGTYDTQRVILTRFQAAVFAPHKIWLHWEHHRFPTIPYHKLEEARAIMNGPTPIDLSTLISKLSHSSFMPSGASID